MRHTHTNKEDVERYLRRAEALADIERIKEEQKQKEGKCTIIDFDKLA